MSLNESLRCFSAFFNSLVNRRVLEESEKKNKLLFATRYEYDFFCTRLSCFNMTVKRM